MIIYLGGVGSQDSIYLVKPCLRQAKRGAREAAILHIAQATKSAQRSNLLATYSLIFDKNHQISSSS